MNGYMQGRQYYFGVQLGAAYKITPDLSVYGGTQITRTNRVLGIGCEMNF